MRIQRAIDELGYVANDAARTMRTGVSRTIGILLQELGAPSNSQVREGAELRAAKAGFAVIASNSAGSEQRQQGYLDLFEAQRVAGMVVAPVGDIEERIRSLQKRGVVVVSLGRPADSTRCSSIAVDDFEGGRLAVSHLIETGHQRLAFVGGPLSMIERRLDGARFAVSQAGLALEIVNVPERTMTQGRLTAEELLARPPSERPDGIFAANDLLAVGLLHGFVRDGSLRVPNDVAIIGYDDIEYAQEAVIPLSSIHTSAMALGRTGIELMMTEISQARAGPPSSVEHVSANLTPKLVIRGTTSG